MATSKDYFIYIQDLLSDIPGLSFRKMMGEYIIYKNSVIVGGIYDNRLLVKKTDSLSSFKMKDAIPYPGAKPMLLVDSEDSDEIEEIINLVYRDLV